MKKYTTPEMKVMAFMAEEAISASGSVTEYSPSMYNDVDLVW